MSGLLTVDVEQLLATAGAFRRQQPVPTGLAGTLEGRVSSLVPGTWNGDAASAFRQHWQHRSTAVDQAAEQARQTSSAFEKLASQLSAAKSRFQMAEQQATANRLYITPAFVVLPY